MDCISSELKEVEDRSLIRYAAESIRNSDIHSLYESFYIPEEVTSGTEDENLEDIDTYILEYEEIDVQSTYRPTIRGQKEKQHVFL